MSVGKSTRIIIFVVIFSLLVVGFYFYVSHRIKRPSPVEEENVVATKVQNVLLKDLSKSYPATPKEVVKFYAELSQCFYNEKYSDTELLALARKAMELYDSELITNQGGEDAYLARLQSDIGDFKNSDVQISSFSTSPATDVDYFEKDGRECAALYCNYSMREGTSLRQSNQLYILRKDESGHWKILGWERDMGNM